MKRLILTAGVLLACTFAFAQNRVLDTYPAHPGKDLSMEDAVLNGVGYARSNVSWQDNETFIVYRDRNRIVQGSVNSENLEPYRPDRTLLGPRDNRGDKGAAGYSVYLEGDSFYGVKDGRTLEIGVSTDRNIVYGGTMMRNEFGFTKGYLWSPDGKKVAYYKKDQSRVTDFPLLNIRTRTGELELIKYPMNGMDSELLQVGVFDFETETTTWMDVTDFSEERFITNLAWSPDAKYLYAQVLDRSQHHMKMNQYRVADGSFVRTLLTEDNDAWVEPQDPVHFLEGRTDVFIYRTDNRDGYKNLYLVDTLGTLRRLTVVDADVEYVANDGKAVFYTSAQNSPVENHLYRIDVQLPRKKMITKAKLGKPVQLTRGRGWHSVRLNANKKWFLDQVSNLSLPGRISRNKNLSIVTHEGILCLTAFVDILGSMDCRHLVSAVAQAFIEIIKRVFVLGENDQLLAVDDAFGIEKTIQLLELFLLLVLGVKGVGHVVEDLDLSCFQLDFCGSLGRGEELEFLRIGHDVVQCFALVILEFVVVVHALQLKILQFLALAPQVWILGDEVG